MSISRSASLANVIPISPDIQGQRFFDTLIEQFGHHSGGTKGGSRTTRENSATTIRQFSRYAAENFKAPYPWQWERWMGEQWVSMLWSVPVKDGGFGLELSTAREYQGIVRRFCEYIGSREPGYPWAAECERLFGRAPVLIFDTFNSIRHSPDPSARGTKRLPLTPEMISRVFNYLDDRVESTSGKSKVVAARNSALFKTLYAYGPRNSEARLIMEPYDFSPSAEFPEYGRYGGLWIRNGKGSRGSGPKTRCVRTVPKFAWIVPVLHSYTTHVLPRMLGDVKSEALFPSEKNQKKPLGRTSLDDIWSEIREALDIDERFKVHCWRHSYMTHLIEAGYPAKFIQLQVGHEHLGSMNVYTSSVGDDFQNTTLRYAQMRQLRPITDPGEIEDIANQIPDECWKL